MNKRYVCKKDFYFYNAITIEKDTIWNIIESNEKYIKLEEENSNRLKWMKIIKKEFDNYFKVCEV